MVNPVLPGTSNDSSKNAVAGASRARPGGSAPAAVLQMPALGFDERSWLAWLVKVRILTITFLLGIELAITRITPIAKIPEFLFVVLIVLWYTIALFFLLLLNLWRESHLQASLQVLTDLAFATGVIYLTGGIDTWFNFLYPLIILVASTLLSRAWAYATALLSFILFGAVLELSYFDVIHSYSSSHGDPKSLQAVIFINLLAYLLIAYLASSLSAKLRQADSELAEKSGELENLQALHGNIINSMNGGLITTDLEGRVTLVNPAAAALLELTGPSVLSKPVTNLFMDKLPNVEASVAHGEVRSVTPAGREKTFAVNVSALALPERGQIGYLYAFDDLTEVRRLEHEVRMRDRFSAIGRMASGIAHEIRNPLSSIAGSVQVLSAISELTEEQQSLVDIVVRESDRLNAIISDFLVYARDKNFKTAPADLVPVLDDALHLLEHRASSTGVQFIRRFETPQAWTVMDTERVRQVFFNLGDCALRSMTEGGALTVTVLPGGDGYWRVNFADTGVGLSAQQVEKIFEPFQGNFEGGTGVGMAIVYQILQAHGARVTVHSTPGHGTDFNLEFKQAARQDTSPPPPPENAVKAVVRG